MRDACLDWLLAACRSWLGAGATGGPDEPCGELDPDLLARMAFTHNLEPLLFALGRDGRLPPGDVPAALAARWEKIYFQNYVFNERLLASLERLLDGVRRSGLAVAVFKGPVTAARAYGDPALRIMHDVDLLVRERDLEPLCRLAREAGYDAAAETSVYHLALADPRLGLGLELHFDLYGFLAERAALLESVLAAPATISLDGRELPAPPPEEGLLLEVAHLVNHDLRVNLKPWLDLAALLGDERLDRPRLAALAGRHDLRREVELLTALAADLFGLGETVRTGPVGAEPAELAAAAERVRGLLLGDGGGPSSALAEAAARAGPAARLGYLRRLLFPPLSHLRAVAGSPSRAAALGALARHLAATAGRGWRNWRRAGLARGGGGRPAAARSVKEPAYRRRRDG